MSIKYLPTIMTLAHDALELFGQCFESDTVRSFMIFILFFPNSSEYWGLCRHNTGQSIANQLFTLFLLRIAWQETIKFSKMKPISRSIRATGFNEYVPSV
jgi:hypothetical protein